MKSNMISTCLALIGLLHPLVYIASAEGQYGPLQPPQCGYSNVTHAEVHSAVLAKRATLISSRHVLTTGVCTLYPDLKVARIGALNLNGDDDGVQPIDVEIEKKIVHPEFNEIGVKNNIAVLKLAKEVSFSDQVRPICLPLTNALESKNLSGSYAAGWGGFTGFPSNISERNTFDQLMEVQVRVVSNEICRKTYTSLKGFETDNRVLCVASINPGEADCKGLRGSPLMLSQDSAFYEIGFVSHGPVFASDHLPCVYTRVSAYMDFITSALK